MRLWKGDLLSLKNNYEKAFDTFLFFDHNSWLFCPRSASSKEWIYCHGAKWCGAYTPGRYHDGQWQQPNQ